MGFSGDFECWFCYVMCNCHELPSFTSKYVYICPDCAEEDAEKHCSFLERVAKVNNYPTACFVCKEERFIVFEVCTCFREE